MKKILFIVTITFVLALTGCFGKKDYNDFEKSHVETFLQAETKNEKLYFVYYYSEENTFSDEVKQDILTFFDEHDVLNYYLLNVDEASDDSSIADFTNAPTVLVMSNGEVVEMFESKTGIERFIFEYSSFDKEDLDSFYTYTMFDHIDTFDDVQTQEEGTYYVYFYSRRCGYCEQIKEYMLEYAANEPDDLKMYFLDGELLPNYSNNFGVTGTPTVLYVQNNTFVEKVSGSDTVIDYLGIETGIIDYSEFDHLTSFNDVETQSEGDYLVYYYTRTCYYCNLIKEEFLDFAKNNDLGIKVYFIDGAINKANGAYDITGTPTLLVIENNEYVEKYVGSNQIPDYIAGLE